MTELLGTVDWLERLVAIDTTSRRANRELIDLVANYLADLGLDPQVLAVGEKANLWCTIATSSGRVDGGVVLSGHTDCVPVDGQSWDSDPFVLTEVGDRLYGRGTTDMKGFLAAVLAAVPTFQQHASEPIQLAFSYDEELGCLGAPALVDLIASQEVLPSACIVGEPTSMRAICAHKSSFVAEVRFTGVAAHSSLTHQGTNAIEYAAEFVRWLRTIADGWRTEGPFDEAYPVPYTTAGVNTISGGIAQNTVPDRCVLRFDYRTVAQVDPEQVLAAAVDLVAELRDRMRQENPLADAELQVLARVPGLDAAVDGPATRLAGELGVVITQDKVTYGTEAGLFAAAGIDAVVCGPGDIAQAHGANEYVGRAQLADCDEVMARLAVKATSGVNGSGFIKPVNQMD